MKKVGFLFLLIGFICFGVSGYVFVTLQNFYKTFAYYGISDENLYLNENVAEIIFNLKYGIIKYLLFGITAWLVSLFLVTKSRKRFNKI